MRIAILAPGSRGDVQPYVALATGLRASGHEVRFVTTRDHAGLVTAHGLDLVSVDLDVASALQDPESRAAVEGGGLVRSFRRFAEIGRRAAHLLVEAGREASMGADAILVGFAGLFTGHALSERTGVPPIQAYNVPFTPTGAFPGPLLPWLSFPPKAPVHRLGHRISRQLVWLTARAGGNAARRSLLQLPPAPLLPPFGRGVLGNGPLLYGISEAVLPKPPEWGPDVDVTGYWFLDEADGWTPPEALVRFLDQGPEPVYLGFGSMSSRDPAETARLALAAVRATGCRAILHEGWGGMRAPELPDSVLAVGSVPHTWLFDRVAAVVHHGGAGTTAAAIRAGVPAVVVPFHGDQPFWARTVARLGLGPEPIPRRRLTAENLAHAIQRALSDPAMRRRAAEVGERVRAEDGVTTAVRVIEERLGASAASRRRASV